MRYATFGFLCLLWGCRSPELQPDHFRHHIIDARPVGGWVCCTDVLATGDLNGDGHTDVLVGAEQDVDEGLVWFAGPDWTRHPIGPGAYTTDGTLADLDGDGDLDLIVSQFDPNGIVWWENKHQATGWTRHRIGDLYAHDLAVADFNRDGRLDVVKSPKGDPGGWYAAPADPRGDWTFHPIPAMRGEGLAVADLDGDGDPDLVQGNAWFEHTPDGTWTRHPIAPDWTAETRIRVVDLNRDGTLDVVLAPAEGTGHIAWFQQTRSGWRMHPITEVPYTGVHSLDAADLDGDGDIDVLAGEMHTTETRRVVWFENRNGTWTPHLLADSGTHNARLADIDGDGDPDVVGKNYAGWGRRIEFWENRLSLLP